MRTTEKKIEKKNCYLQKKNAEIAHKIDFVVGNMHKVMSRMLRYVDLKREKFFFSAPNCWGDQVKAPLVLT